MEVPPQALLLIHRVLDAAVVEAVSEICNSEIDEEVLIHRVLDAAVVEAVSEICNSEIDEEEEGLALGDNGMALVRLLDQLANIHLDVDREEVVSTLLASCSTNLDQTLQSNLYTRVAVSQSLTTLGRVLYDSPGVMCGCEECNVEED